MWRNKIQEKKRVTQLSFNIPLHQDSVSKAKVIIDGVTVSYLSLSLSLSLSLCFVQTLTYNIQPHAHVYAHKLLTRSFIHTYI